jgi:hypothetical protein
MADGEESGINILSILDSIGPEKLDKYERYIKSIGEIVDKLNKNGLIDGVVKVIAKKQGIDVTDLRNPLSTIAPSNTHKFLYDILNGAPEDVVKTMLIQMMKQTEQQNKEPKPPAGIKTDEAK